MKKKEYDIAIQKADYKDLPIILEIQKTAFLEEAKFYNDYKIAPLTQSLDEIQKDYQDHLFLIATYLNQIIGSVKLREQSSHPNFKTRASGINYFWRLRNIARQQRNSFFLPVRKVQKTLGYMNPLDTKRWKNMPIKTIRISY